MRESLSIMTTPLPSYCLSRRQLLNALFGLGAILISKSSMLFLADSLAQSPDIEMAPLIKPPDDVEQWPIWRAGLTEWRVRTRSQLNYDNWRYRTPEATWVSSSFSSCFLMLCDETFFDKDSGHYRVESFLEQARDEFGGFDNVILWHAYPRIGADDRNQFDFYRDMPGGLAGLKDVVGRCHKLGVKAFIVYTPWDRGTRQEGISHADALVIMVRAIAADGVYLDTSSEEPPGLREGLDSIGPGLTLEGEAPLPLEHVHDHQLSWAQKFEDSMVPGILRNKWYERRHMMHQISRWRRSRTEQLHMAWMNGSGMVIWENVFGSWVGWSERDRAMLRSMVPIQRRFVDLLSGEAWTPLVSTEQAGIYANLWQGSGICLWTLVNRTDRPISGPLIRTEAIPGERYYDLVAGRELRPEVNADAAILSGNLLPHGIGAFVAGNPVSLGRDFLEFLSKQRGLQASESRPDDFPSRPVIPVSQPANIHRRRSAILNGEMIDIPSAQFTMHVQMRTRECGFYGNEMIEEELYKNFDKPQWFEHEVTLPSYAIDLTPVTNDQYAEFLAGSHYEPQYGENFLKHWVNGQPPSGKGDHPVVYVSLEDARAYANWSGMTLPTEEQWQYAAQGPLELMYPWGATLEADRCNGGETGTTTGVLEFPRGRSPFGCYDMCGNVWEWTESERSDGRTRFCIIRGGSYYTARGSLWYMDGGPKPTNFAAKFILMWPGLDRCATIGFRCTWQDALYPGTAGYIK
jgi:formylglycine-generating enzyme required for sulfatase activity